MAASGKCSYDILTNLSYTLATMEIEPREVVARSPILRGLEEKYEVSADSLLACLYFTLEWSGQDIQVALGLGQSKVPALLKRLGFSLRSNFETHSRASQRTKVRILEEQAKIVRLAKERGLLEFLRPHQRKVLELRYLQGDEITPFDQVVHQAGKEAVVVSQYQSKGIAFLKKRLGIDHLPKPANNQHQKPTLHPDKWRNLVQAREATAREKLIAKLGGNYAQVIRDKEFQGVKLRAIARSIPMDIGALQKFLKEAEK